MKKVSLFVIALLILAGNSVVTAQPGETPPKASSGISFFASTLLFATPVNISYDRLYPVGKTHMGYTTGFTTLFLARSLYDTYIICGGHLAYTMLAGSRRRQFEMKLGFSYTPFVLASDYSDNQADFVFLPVVSLGFRKKAKEGKGFFRFAVSTGGIGIGFGSML
jgi:hypothetical protein